MKKKLRVFNITKNELIFISTAVVVFVTAAILFGRFGFHVMRVNAERDYIKWIEFNARLSSMQKALKYDIDSYGTETPLCWIELLSYAAARNWGNMKEEKKINNLIDECVKKLNNGATIEELTAQLKLYDYYYETYYSVLSGFVGEYELIGNDDDNNNNNDDTVTKKYGLKVFSPVAKGFGYSHYDDFGNSRSYGYKRRHLGNDLLGRVGTPVIAVEDGYIEALGWNQYGGWRIGIRTHDTKRYYYYAHLRKDHPFKTGLKEGDFVQAGDVIGYLGMTGYSRKENVNNIEIPHLHFGLQIIFDEVQKDGINQIWIDVYNMIRFLERNRMSVERDSGGKDYERTIRINNIVTD
jgi:murein DD-endopeptidase MepM/ murein hydrolase activator NlpD